MLVIGGSRHGQTWTTKESAAPFPVELPIEAMERPTGVTIFPAGTVMVKEVYSRRDIDIEGKSFQIMVISSMSDEEAASSISESFLDRF